MRPLRPPQFVLLTALALGALAAPAPAAAQTQLSEAERKATARALFTQAAKEQEAGRYNEALALFEKAQKLFDAPTHLARIAQCQAASGKLVEAAETYETLKRVQLAPGAPEVFVEAKARAEAELPGLRARIPTLRLELTPRPSELRNLQLVVNDVLIPADLVGVARPVNPGPTKIVVKADGYKDASLDVSLKEREQRAVALALTAGQSSLPVVLPPPGKPSEPAPQPRHYEPDKGAAEPKEPGTRITLAYVPNIPLNTNNPTSYRELEHNLGLEFIFGKTFRYHLLVAFSALGGAYGFRFEPLSFGVGIPVFKKEGLRVEVEPGFQLLNLNLLAGGNAGLASAALGGDLRVNLALGKFFVSLAPVGIELRYALAGFSGRFSGGATGSALDFRPRLLVGLEF